MAATGLLPSFAPGRILVLRALQLGDVLCAVPALRALRRAAPRAHIALCGLPWAKAFVERFASYVNEFIEFPGFPGLPERACDPGVFPGRFAAFLREVQGRRFDLAVQLHGSGSVVNSIVALVGARQTAGFYRPGEHFSDNGWHPEDGGFLPWPESGHEIERLLALVRFLGAAEANTDLEFPIRPADWEELAQDAATRRLLDRPYVCLHPGARFLSRRWPPERFAAVGDALAESGLRVAFTGTAEEHRTAAAVGRAMTAPHLNLAGRTSLGAAAALVSGARLVVTNDTGMSHIAAAVGTPSVVVVLGSDPSRWAPLDRQRHRAIWAPVACRPCGHFACPVGFPCAFNLECQTVLAECWRLLEENQRAVRSESSTDCNPYPCYTANTKEESPCAVPAF